MRNDQQGFTLVEIIISLLIVTIIMAAFSGLVSSSLNFWQYNKARLALNAQANFAMDRMVDAVYNTRRLLLPLGENPATVYLESERALLAVTLDPTMDSDNDTVADADNDKDGLIDEDIPVDNNNDGAAGIIGIDDDGDGTIDENTANPNSKYDNDEDGSYAEDYLDGEDNDNDGSIDEDIPHKNYESGSGFGADDNDEDGQKHEDWFDPVVFYVSSDQQKLFERLPNINPTDGADFTEHIIAEAETVTLAVKRLPMGLDDRVELVEIDLRLSSEQGGDLTLNTRVRIGGGK